jgi:hypothetical protein
VNSTSSKCITACIVAALHPQIARVLPPKQPSSSSSSSSSNFSTLLCGTNDGSTVSVHPSSVNAKEFGSLPYPFLSYLEKTKTNNTIWIRDTCVVSPYLLVLFAGASSYLPQYEELAYSSWLSFTCNSADAALLLTVKRRLDQALAAKINDPSSAWESAAGTAVSAIVKLIHEESSTSLRLREDRRGGGRGGGGSNSEALLAQPSTKMKANDPFSGLAIGGGGGGGGSGATTTTSSNNNNNNNNIVPPLVDADGKKLSYGARVRMMTRFCHHCGERGHLSSLCPFKNRRRVPGAPDMPCFICGGGSHHPPDCVLTKQRVLPEGVSSATFGFAANEVTARPNFSGGGRGRGGNGGRGGKK